MALLISFWAASTYITFSAKNNLNIYTENSYELAYSVQGIKKWNIFVGYIYNNDSDRKPLKISETTPFISYLR